MYSVVVLFVNLYMYVYTLHNAHACILGILV